MSRIIKAEALATSVHRSAAAGTALSERPRHNGSRSAQGVVEAASIVRSASKRAAAILRSAETAAARMVSEESERIDQLRSNAADQGYHEGYARGYEEGQERARQDAWDEVNAQLASIHKAINELTELRHQALSSAEADIVKFAVLIAERIVRAELGDPERTMQIARSVLSELREESRVSLYLPEEVAELTEQVEQLTRDRLAMGMHLEIMADPSLSLGDVRVETEWGWIDGRARVRWQRLVEALQRGADHGDD